MKKIILAALLVSACTTPRHFEATERCGPRGVEEWAVYHDVSGRLRVEIWCLPRDR